MYKEFRLPSSLLTLGRGFEGELVIVLLYEAGEEYYQSLQLKFEMATIDLSQLLDRNYDFHQHITKILNDSGDAYLVRQW